MFIKKWLCCIFGNVSKGTVVDPWDGSHGAYVSEFREKLDKLAQELSQKNDIVLTRYVPNLKCAELYSHEGKILVQINVHGECGVPCKAVIICFAISMETMAQLMKIFPFTVKFNG